MTSTTIDWFKVLGIPEGVRSNERFIELRDQRHEALKQAFPGLSVSANNWSVLTRQATVSFNLRSGGWVALERIKQAMLTLVPYVIPQPQGRVFDIGYTNQHRKGKVIVFFSDERWHFSYSPLIESSHRGAYSSEDLSIVLQVMFHHIYGGLK